MSIITRLKDPGSWLYGLLSAFITGLANAALNYVSFSIAHDAGAAGVPDPATIAFKVWAIIALVGGLVGALSYLKQSPLPGLTVVVLAGSMAIGLQGCAWDTPPAASGSDPEPASTGKTISLFAAKTAGAVMAIGIVETAGQNQAVVARDGLSCCSAAYTLLTGAMPTNEQAEAVMDSFGAEGNSPMYGIVSGLFLDQFLPFLKDAPGVEYGRVFVEGAQLAFNVYVER